MTLKSVEFALEGGVRSLFVAGYLYKGKGVKVEH